MSGRYNYLIVGAGLAGAVFAQAAHEHGKKVIVLEKRDHIGGNAYTEKMNGVTVHRYGAHIFHTNDEKVWEYVNRFAAFNCFINSPVANCRGEIYSLPFNMNTFKEMWGITDPAEAEARIREQSSVIAGEPENLEEQAISLVGTDIYEKLIKGYTEKQWGRACGDLPASIIRRIPVRFTFDNNYFNAKYQGIPVKGYTELVGELLRGIEVRLNTDYLEDRERWNGMADRIVYSGAIDAFYDYCFGPLEYRSVRFETESLDIPSFQGNAVVNYTDSDTPWTRIIEHKWFTFGKDEDGREIPGTVISREYSTEWHPGEEPYYPVNDAGNGELYRRYRELADREEKVLFIGRLGEYNYYDMDQVIARSLETAEVELGG